MAIFYVTGIAHLFLAPYPTHCKTCKKELDKCSTKGKCVLPITVCWKCGKKKQGNCKKCRKNNFYKKIKEKKVVRERNQRSDEGINQIAFYLIN